METAIYNQIGNQYDNTRSADPTITDIVYEELQGKTHQPILDIGCGTGNYALALHKKGASMIGVDISEVMLEKAKNKSKDIQWVLSSATNLTLDANSVGGAMCINAVQHIGNMQKTFKEIYRVLKKGCFVIFTPTPECMKHYWLNQYFPQMMVQGSAAIPSGSLIEETLRGAQFSNVRTRGHFIEAKPRDLFLYAGKNNPEIYLDAKVRNEISTFTQHANPNELETGLKQLEMDIKSGYIETVIQKFSTNHPDYCFIIGEKV